MQLPRTAHLSWNLTSVKSQISTRLPQIAWLLVLCVCVHNSIGNVNLLSTLNLIMMCILSQRSNLSRKRKKIVSRIEIIELSIVCVLAINLRGRHVDLLNSFILAMDLIIQTDTEHRLLTFLIFNKLKS